MTKNNSVSCVGELLIDFVCSDVGTSLQTGETFLKKAGGAPANVACCIARLGGQAKLGAKVGADAFGAFLKQVVSDEKVDCSSVVTTDKAYTTLAYVALQEDGERDFSFYWGAHDQLQYEELQPEFITESNILHLGGALTDGNIVTLYRNLVTAAKAQNKLISFDPNYRQALWADKNIADFIAITKEFIADADILKVSEEEAQLITETEDLESAIKSLHETGAKIIFITLGSKGTLVSFNNKEQTIVPSIKIKSIDSTGAGDAFIGAILYQMADAGSLPNSFIELVNMVKFANKVGAITCTKMGAIPALPYPNEL